MESVLDAVSWLLDASWAFFTDCRIPVLDISFATLLIGFALIDIFFKLLGLIVGVHFPSDVPLFGRSSKGQDLGRPSSTRYLVAPERAHDEK